VKLDVNMPVEADHLANIVRIARAAEELGFAGLWTSETRHDAFLPLVLAAEHSERIELGTAVAIAFPRSPMVMAQLAWDLASLSHGRFLLGLGTQVKAHIERRFGMTWDAPVARLRDYIAALRAIWTSFQTGAPLRYEGRYYRHTLMTPFFNPGPIPHPEIPILIAGVNTGLAQLAGEVAQGFHVHPFHSVRYLDEILKPAIAAGAGRTKREPSSVELVTSVFVITGSDASERERLRAAVREQIAFYASTPTYRSVLECHGWAEIGEELSRLAKRQQWAAMPALVDDAMLQTFAVEAEPDELGNVLRQRYHGVIDRLSLYLPFVPGERDTFWRATIRAIQD
jgi:probable F420-dependent oxidoreductase